MKAAYRRRMSGLVLFLALALAAGCKAAQPTIPATVDEVPRIRAQELKALLDAGREVVIVDTRSLESYQEKHLPGAISIPLEEWTVRQAELPKRAKIVTYCT